MKRTKYLVHCPGEHVARFSSEGHARIFAIALSRRAINFRIEISAPDGLIGQYCEGRTTEEFKAHHESSAI